MKILDTNKTVGLLENSYYSEFIKGWKLIGFMPCSKDETYYSVRLVTGERVVPLFLGKDTTGMRPAKGDDARWQSDEEYRRGDWNRDHHWVLYFMGCDNGSMSKRFESKEAVLDWLEKLEIDEYSQILADKESYGLTWVNS